ncbi:MAG: hypothetical protein HFJ31_00980, partial [Clostridia bacterium]|nr:hypothetical protein [Clostridia bacterium]
MNVKLKRKVVSGALLCTICAYSMPVFAFSKEETVYTKLDKDGKNYSTIVSTHLKNEEETEWIKDMTDLFNVENTKGEEEFKQEGNSLVWKADKKDIYYQGESQKELPIACCVTYELDGKELSAEEIVGKTGKVKVTIHYTNKEEHIVTINGKEQKLYTPFVAVAGTVIPNDKNKNIEISNGKVINDGSKTLVMGVSMPGLQESLNISNEEMLIPDDIEISMEATDFELGNIVTFVTPKVLEEEDLKFLDKLEEVYQQVDMVETAGNQIEEGSTALASGSAELVLGSKKLNEGSQVAYQGAKQMREEVEKATKQLVNDKKEVLDDATLSQIGEQAKQSAVLNDTQEQAIGNKAQAQAIQMIKEQKTIIGQEAANQVGTLLLTAEQKQKIEASVKVGLEANSNYQALPVNQQEMILQFSKSSAIMAAEETARETAKQVANMTAQNVAVKVAGEVANSTAQTVAGEVSTQVAQITAMTTAKQVANQVKTQAQNQVVSQMNTLGDGLSQLTNGLGDLKNGTNSLQQGASELQVGANTLEEGVEKFNKEAIERICDYMNGDVREVHERVEKLIELSKDYNHFTMLNGECDGEVKFVMIIDAIKRAQVEQENKEDTAFLNEKREKEKE